MPGKEENMRVNELAENIHVTADTVRYYTRIGLLSPQKKAAHPYAKRCRHLGKKAQWRPGL